MASKFKVICNFISNRWLMRFKNRKELEKYQNKMLKKQLKFLMNNSEFYKKFLKTQNFYDLPIMDKNKMMDNFDILNTVGITKKEAMDIAINGERTRDFKERCKDITVGLSSGTSGHRGVFIVSEDEEATWAGTVLAKLLPKWKILNNKIAFFLRANSNLYEAVNSSAIKFKYFDIFNPMSENIIELYKYMPTILVAPPSILIQIAKAQEKGDININPIRIISVAEILEERDCKYIEKVFKRNIYQVYQCTEGFLGYTCECGSFHINEDIIKMEKEWIDEKRFIPIITDFRRKSQPIIRYRLNDILVTENRKCDCGLPMLVIERIEGRDDDVFIFDSKDGKECRVFPDFIRRCILFVDGVREYRVQQLDKENINIEINSTKGVKDLIVIEFEKLSKELNFKLPNITFSNYRVTDLKKLKRVERVFKEENIYEKC